MAGLKIAYAGLGNMGENLSVHLANYARANGGSLTVWNRSKGKYDSVKAELGEGVTYAAGDVDELAGADVIFVSVLNDAASTDVVTRLTAKAKGAVIVDQSSLNPKTSIALEQLAAKSGNAYLAAPVFGRPDAAKAGKLIQVVAGNKDAKAKVRPLFNIFARAVLDLGEEVQKGNTLKLMGNALILGVIELLAETYALGDALDIDPSVFQQFIDLFFPTPSYGAYGNKIGKGTFGSAGGFRLEGGLKDANNILNVGADLGHPVNLPTIALAKEHMERAVELGGIDMDWSSLSAVLRERAGLEPFKVKQDEPKQ